MSEILTLRIRLSGARGEDRKWRRVIEIPEDASLEDLHYTIQDLINFDNDHMFEFYIGRSWRQHKMEIGEAANPEDPGENEKIRLSDVYPLEKNLKVYYWFDFGDSWIFEITRRAGTKAPNRRAKYPRVVEKEGRNPPQYSW